MSLKDTIAKVRAAIEEQVSAFPVRCMGLEIGEAKEWEVWCPDDTDAFYLYYDFKASPELTGILGDWNNICIDYEEGYVYKFVYDDTENTIDIEWEFHLELFPILSIGSDSILSA